MLVYDASCSHVAVRRLRTRVFRASVPRFAPAFAEASAWQAAKRLQQRAKHDVNIDVSRLGMAKCAR
jgi:hypothetical protein